MPLAMLSEDKRSIASPIEDPCQPCLSIRSRVAQQTGCGRSGYHGLTLAFIYLTAVYAWAAIFPL